MKNILSLKLMPKALLLVAFCMVCSCLQGLSAQEDASKQGRVVTGTVVDAMSEPLIGVSVTLVGTSKGTITDLDGKYTIQLDKSSGTLKFTYTGFLQQEISVGNKKEVNVVMREDARELDEVVVVGYGVQKKSHLTGSITKVKTDGLDDIPVSRVDQALQGRIAGVQIQNLTSEVGEAPQVRVRGMGSLSAGAEPLIIIDGVPVPGGLGMVSMNDVESIEVLKDAASAAIYGSRAANGVIIIETKKGTANKPKYTLKTSWGTKSAYKTHPIMTSKEYVDMRVKEHNLIGTKLNVNEMAFLAIDNETDWQDEGLRTANIYNLQFGISGGSKDVKYYVSGSYSNDQGIMLNNEYQKMNVRAKIDANLSKRVTVGLNMAPSYSWRTKPATDYINFYRTPSWMPVRHTAQTAAITGQEEGSYAHGNQFNSKFFTGINPHTGVEETFKASPFNTANHNPRMILDNEEVKMKDYRMQMSAYLDVLIFKGLNFKTTNSANVTYNDSDIYRNKASRVDGDPNRGLYQNNLYISLISENTFTYHTQINKDHDITGLLGFSVEKNSRKQAGILGKNFATDDVHTLNAAGSIEQFEADSKGNPIQYTGTWRQEDAMASFFSRLTYAYKDRYLLSASVRTDGSSKFGVDKQWGWFPSISLGWRVTEESFLKDNPKFGWLSQLKFRTSYGVTGTNDIMNYANTDKLQSANYILGLGNGSVAQGLANNLSTLGNPKLQWEQTNEFNAGLDLSFINNRIGLTFDYYYSVTDRLLFEKNINSVSGYKKEWSNEGKVRNRGLEIELSTFNIQNADFTWNTSFNFATNDNKLLDLGGSAELINYGERNEMYLSRVGGPAIQFYGFKTIGIWKSQEELNSNPHHVTETKPGGLRVQNTNGDNVIDDKDLVVLGDPFPDFTWGINNNFKYRNVDLSVLVQGVQGIDAINGDEFYGETRKWNRNYVTNRWVSPDHPGDGKTPFQSEGINHMLTDHVIQDASYIALRDITIGYTLPKKMLKKGILSKMRLYASIQNLGYWWTSDYKGINPEARSTSGNYKSPLIAGYQRGAYPLQRVFNFGIDITF